MVQPDVFPNFRASGICKTQLPIPATDRVRGAKFIPANRPNRARRDGADYVRQSELLPGSACFTSWLTS